MNWWDHLIENAPSIGASLGVGSAPFVLAILRNKLRPNGQFEELKAAHALQIEQVEKNAQGREALLQSELGRSNEARETAELARDKERDRADTVTAKLSEVTSEYGGAMVHLLEGLRTLPGELDA